MKSAGFKIKNIKMKVQVNGYGMLPFRATECHKFDGREDLVQFRGEVKLPKGVRTGGGSKWMSHDYWYTPEQITPTYNTPPSEADNFKKANDFVTAEILAYLFGPQCGGESCTNPNCSCKKAEGRTFKDDPLYKSITSEVKERPEKIVVNDSAKESFGIRQVGTLDDIDKNVYKIYFTADGGKSYYRTSICKFVIDKDIHSDSRTDLVTEQCELDMLALWEKRAEINEDFSEAIAVDVKYKPDGVSWSDFIKDLKSAGLKEDKKIEPTFEELEIERVKQAMQTLNLEHPDEVGFYKSLLNVCQQLNEIYLY